MCPWRALPVLAVALTALPLCATTTITISDRSLVTGVKRLGINLGTVSYYDDRQIMKEIVFRNPGFEGLVYGSVVRCAAATATSFTDNNPNDAWPSGFWNGASFEVISGPARGRTGMIAASLAPSGGQGTSFQFAASGAIPATGDFMILHKRDPAFDATYGWIPMTGGGGTISGEAVALAPDAAGVQAVRLSASGAGQTASLSAVFDSTAGMTFLQLNGAFRLTFKARSAGGANTLTVVLRRNAPSGTTLLSRTINLGPTWSNQSIDFTAGETGAIGSLQLQFSVAQSAVVLDEVSLTRTDGDPGNPTRFRDPVVAALQSLRPGLLRYWAFQLGDTLDNQLAAPMSRLRSGFRTANATGDDLQIGLHEFLELAEHIGAEPWIVMPITFSAAEMRGLIDYFVGDASTLYGGQRAARGRPQPWTDAFPLIHLELGNETWNLGQRGATIEDPAAYGSRGQEIFTAARSATGFSAAKFDLVLGGWAADTNHTRTTHNASSTHDAIALGPYFGGRIDSFATPEELFGPLFAEPEMLSQTGFMRQNYTNIQGSARPVPLAVYEVNLHTTEGAISQSALDSFTPSIGAGLAVADHMLTMLARLGIRHQMLYSLSGYRFIRTDGKAVLLWGSVRDFGVSDRKRPQFLALRLVNGAIGGNLVETIHGGDDPTWVQPLVNGVQYPAAHYLRSYAFVNGTSRALIVFNFHRTSALEISLSGTGAPTGSVTLNRLSAPAITDSNESSERVITTTEALSSVRDLSLPPFSMTVLEWQTTAGRRRSARH